MDLRRTATRRGDAGFTLIELLVVIVIIGILAAIAIPVFLNQRNKAYDTSAKSDLRTAMLSLQTQGAFSPTGFSVNTAEMQAYEPSIKWLTSHEVDTTNPPVGVVTWEYAQGGTQRETAVLGIRSRSNRCFYLRIVEDGSLTPGGVSYYSQAGPCPDPWDRTAQMTRSSY